MWCNKDDKGTDIGNVKHSGPFRQKESSMAAIAKGRLFVKVVVGHVKRERDVLTLVVWVCPPTE